MAAAQARTCFPARKAAAGAEAPGAPAPTPDDPLATGSGEADAGKIDRPVNEPDPPPPASRNPFDGIGTVMVVASGYGSLEGPLWRPGSKSLLFSDLSANSIERFAPPSTLDTYRFPSGGSNGLALDSQGRLVVCERNNRRVTRTLGGGSIEVVASDYQGAAFNAPNDVISRSDGNIYFTDPDYSVAGPKELAFNGVYRVTPTGTVELVADDLTKPNGIALSPDEKTLYVTDERGGFIRAYDVGGDGSTSNGRKLVEAPNPDGIAVDDDGNLYAATKTGVLVVKPDGDAWGTLDLPKQPANLAFGGTSRKTLFITAADTLYQIEMTVPGPS